MWLKEENFDKINVILILPPLQKQPPIEVKFNNKEPKKIIVKSDMRDTE